MTTITPKYILMMTYHSANFGTGILSSIRFYTKEAAMKAQQIFGGIIIEDEPEINDDNQ